MRLPLALVVLLLVPLAPHAQARVEAAPVLAPGDFWEYQANITRDGEALANESQRVEVLDLQDGLLRIRTFTVRVTAEGASTMDQVAWHRPSDLALVKAQTYTRSLTEGGYNTAENLTTYDPPCAERTYPFDAGATWTLECIGWTSAKIDFRYVNRTANRSDRIVVRAEESIRVAEADVDAWPVVTAAADGTPQQTAWYAPSVCRDARLEVSLRGVGIHSNLTAWRCASRATGVGAPTLAFPTRFGPAPLDVEIPPARAPAPPTLLLLATLGALALVARPKGS